MAVARSKLKIAMFWLILLVASVLLVEVVLQAACLVFPNVAALLTSGTGLYVPDEKLGWRPNPHFPEHDSSGWRNRTIPKHPAIVALGDSMTYGVWVKREDAWPQQLEKMLGPADQVDAPGGSHGGKSHVRQLSVYNMAFSGYDPTTYWLMLDEVLALHPTLVIEAVYSGNDLWEAYSNVYHSPRFPRMRTANEALLESLAAKDRVSAVEQTSQQLFEPYRGLKNFLEQHSKIYAVLWLSKAIFFPSYTAPWYWTRFKASRFPPWEVFEHGEIRTILTPRYRFLALNEQDSRIQEGLRVSEMAIKQTHDRLRAAGVPLLVLLLPTKELVLEPFVSATNLKDPTVYRRLVHDEKQAWKSLQGYLVKNGIHCADALPALRNAVQSGNNPFHMNQDGHPSEEGQRAIAATALDAIRNGHLLKPE
jgi:lysophospholipase L1-like esterase